MDEVRDDKRRWKPERSLSFSRFTSTMFVDKARTFIEKFVDEKQLFRSIDGKLVVDKTIAQRISFISYAEFDTRFLVLPVVGKDKTTNQPYEGVAICIRDMSNYIVLSYDEFVSFVKYLDGFDFDIMALTLLNTAIMSQGVDVLSGNSVVLGTSNTESEYSTPAVDRKPTIPKLN